VSGTLASTAVANKNTGNNITNSNTAYFFFISIPPQILAAFPTEKRIRTTLLPVGMPTIKKGVQERQKPAITYTP
jgi:hypothetical protein